MDNDMIARRTEHLTPAGRDHLAEIHQATDADDHGQIPAIVERMGELPPSERDEITELIGLLGRAAQAEASRLASVAEAAEGAQRAILAAQDKLRAEGKSVDPNMTVGEAYEVLGR